MAELLPSVGIDSGTISSDFTKEIGKLITAEYKKALRIVFNYQMMELEGHKLDHERRTVELNDCAACDLIEQGAKLLEEYIEGQLQLQELFKQFELQHPVTG